jgi:hypothetical protein
LKSVIFHIFFLLYFCTKSYSQKTILSSGKDASGSGGSVSYSIGQVTYLFNTGNAGSEAQGIQQPYEISVVQVIKNANILKIDNSYPIEFSSSAIASDDNEKFINLKCVAYPNPTIDILTLTVEFIEKGNINLKYQLFDLNGKLIESKKIENNSTNIEMYHLVPAIYILSVIKGNKSVKTFQIIKN